MVRVFSLGHSGFPERNLPISFLGNQAWPWALTRLEKVWTRSLTTQISAQSPEFLGFVSAEGKHQSSPVWQRGSGIQPWRWSVFSLQQSLSF